MLQCVAVWCSLVQRAAVCDRACTFRCSVLQRVAVPQYFSLVQCGAVWCSVVQCGAVWCSVVQCGVVWCCVVQCVAVCCSVLQCVAVCCNVLQCVAVCRSVLRCVAVYCSVFVHSLQHTCFYVTWILIFVPGIIFRDICASGLCLCWSWWRFRCAAVLCSVLWCVAACCSVLQRVAVCCVLQRVAACCSVLQYDAVCWSVYVTHAGWCASDALCCSICWGRSDGSCNTHMNESIYE